MSYRILPERPGDAGTIEQLLDRTFGFDRRQKTVYRLREGLPPLPGLSFIVLGEEELFLASIRYWPIFIGALPAILLGPLAVEPAEQGRGMGKSLVRHSLAEARRQSHRIAIVVGDPKYYGPFGFTSATAFGLSLPGPVELPRFQALELVPGALEGVSGTIRRADGRLRRSLRRAAGGA